MGDWGENNLINELVQGRELARHLQMCLNVPSTSQETREMLIQRIIAAFEKALAMLSWNGGSGSNSKQPAGVMSDSPPFSPRSEDSDKDFRDQDQHASTKRSTLARWTKQIRVSPGVGVESLLDDGFSWRKYGQKDILGAKFPRGYYRCTHRHVQGCLATKQVQRSDEDPTIIEVNYKGNHTCKLACNAALPSLQPQSQEQLVNLRAGLRVLTENLDASDQNSFVSFQLPSASNMKPDNQEFLCPMIETFSSPPYLSPATSATTHFSVSPRGVNSFGEHQNLPTSASDANHMTSPENSPTVGWQFPFDQFEFDGHNFTFDNSRYF